MEKAEIFLILQRITERILSFQSVHSAMTSGIDCGILKWMQMQRKMSKTESKQISCHRESYHGNYINIISHMFHCAQPDSFNTSHLYCRPFKLA